MVPNIAAFEESVQVDGLADPQAKFRRAQEIRVTERCPLCLGLFGRWVEAARSDRELAVPAQGLSVLCAAKRERLGVEERAGVAEDRARPRRQADNEDHRLAAEHAAADVADRSIRPYFGGIALEGRRAAQRSAVELARDGLEAALGRERETDAGIVRSGKSKRGAEAVLAAIRD